jgi:class 3 adenylate cyclase
MRIGVHTVLAFILFILKGNIIGGIIGTDILRYDIYGGDVVIANKMESNGIPGCICISEHTKNILEAYSSQEKFNF